MTTLRDLLKDENQLEAAERDLSLLLAVLDLEEVHAPVFPIVKSVLVNHMKNTYDLRGKELNLAVAMYSLVEPRLSYLRGD